MYGNCDSMESSEVEAKHDAAGLSTCATEVNGTPLSQSPLSSGFLGFFSSLSCCVSSRKVYTGELGTGARSRKHKHHQHMHPVKAVVGNRDLVNPVARLETARSVPSSGVSSASMKSSPMLENWMERFGDWRLVDIPVFPGTHHSGVNNPRKRTSQPVWGWAKCQDIGIEEQLHIGVRFFDLRIRVIPKTNEVLISHGLTSDTSLAEALDVIAGYLHTHSTEGVILYIRADKWHGIDAECSQLLLEVITGSKITLSDETNGLKDFRVKHLAGKALIVTPEETFAPVAEASTLPVVPFISSTCLQYCDIWQAGSIEEAKAKIDEYMTNGVRAVDAFGGVALDGTFPIRQQSQTSRELNAWFIEKLSNEDKWKDKIELGQFGIVLIDFADFDILTFLIGINNKLMTIRATG